LPEQVDTELGEIDGEALRAVLHREIELASMRWAREGELLPVGEPTAKSVSPVFSASEACAGMALQAAKRSSGSVASRFRGRDMPIRIVRQQDQFSVGLRHVLKDIG
jgi:hypothetical protein